MIYEITNLENKLKTLNVEQMEVVEYIKNKIDQQILLFLNGDSGCGKTYLLNLIDNMLTMNGMTVQKLGTTGYSANLIDGQNVHGFFSINYLLKCRLQYDSSIWHTIKQNNVIIIDECSLMSDELINLIDEILWGVYTENMNKSVVKYKFGEKKIILVGDLFQLAAVSTFAQPITQLYKSLIFKNNFTPFILTKNMRAGGCCLRGN